jgi:hypothetical protein
MSLGAVVWTLIASLFVIWTVITFMLSPRLASIVDVARSLLGAPLGRIILLAGWAELGWHLFCQRP